MFVPSDPASPIPTKYLDVMRTTYTDLDTKEEKRMEDYWNVQGEKALSDFWVGKTVFYILRTPPEPGFTYIYGRKTKIQSDTNRPGDMWPEVWNDLGKGKKKKAIEKWKITKVKPRGSR